ncbi:transglycosylase SLT domain-containing protein [Microvirga sp. 17 mud 1-3]|uniref:transglycosylase SLT domain-containing protein n=1 Tax=Microvirga sp. 17 mud 1-3 TaxID=2082949 RepID=UPI000D6B35E4|nr:transglycosylase SLT domain-containing protein [Microvirga sp. 17 mud 1-3]AWM86424.1 lytic transglycosylase [Microvirga sp. 17 mud 1-3]
MTLPHLMRTVAVASLGIAVLAIATRAHAEGGEGASVVPPEPLFENQVADAAVTDSAPEAAKADDKATTASIVPAIRIRTRVSDEARAETLKPLIQRYAAEHELPYSLADAVVRVESRYNPAARNGPNMGLTQINVRTAQALGYQGNAAGLLDAETNLRYGLKYLAQAYRLAGGDTCGTILRYQFGHRTQTMTRASRAYCAKVKVITAKAD